MWVGALLGGGTVVTVSCGRRCAVLGGALGVGDMLGGADVWGAAEIAVRGAGAPTVAFVVALSPLLMMTAVAIAPIAMTAPMNKATDRHRWSAGHAHSSSSLSSPKPSSNPASSRSA
jgi:hypothetical protein